MYLVRQSLLVRLVAGCELLPCAINVEIVHLNEFFRFQNGCMPFRQIKTLRARPKMTKKVVDLLDGEDWSRIPALRRYDSADYPLFKKAVALK